MQDLIHTIISLVAVCFITKFICREISDLKKDLRELQMENREKTYQIDKICQKLKKMQDGEK